MSAVKKIPCYRQVKISAYCTRERAKRRSERGNYGMESVVSLDGGGVGGVVCAGRGPASHPVGHQWPAHSGTGPARFDQR